MKSEREMNLTNGEIQGMPPLLDVGPQPTPRRQGGSGSIFIDGELSCFSDGNKSCGMRSSRPGWANGSIISLGPVCFFATYGVGGSRASHRSENHVPAIQRQLHGLVHQSTGVLLMPDPAIRIRTFLAPECPFQPPYLRRDGSNALQIQFGGYWAITPFHSPSSATTINSALPIRLELIVLAVTREAFTTRRCRL